LPIARMSRFLQVLAFGAQRWASGNAPANRTDEGFYLEMAFSAQKWASGNTPANRVVKRVLVIKGQ